MTGMSIRAATPADWAVARTLLERAGLPVDDLGEDRLDRFLIADSGDNVAGMIGIEDFGEVGLLRSLVVADTHRREGVGEKLVAALEDAARKSGVRDLWLLTIDADAYFERLGFETRSRDEAPEVVRGTREFSELCPGDAVLMWKPIRAQ